MTVIADYSQQLAKVLSSVGANEFPARLITMLKALVPVSDATIVVYPNTDLPEIDYYEPGPEGASHLDQFVGGTSLLDPYYQVAARDRLFGFFCLKELSPRGFKDSEYYNSWYRHSRYQDECGYLVDTGGEGFVNISLARRRGLSSFGKRQLALLDDIAPVVERLCSQHWGGRGIASGSENLRGQLQSALESFGSAELTDREAQVINLVLHGHSTATIAQELCISTETVKLHRKHAYAKLEVNTQAELFYLFLNFLTQTGLGADEGPPAV
jgi:DNA-binding CsgD family transcriptional regulator